MQTRRLIAAITLATACTTGLAADKPPAANGNGNAKALSALCDGCAIVNAVREEQRKGKGSGLGAVGGAVVGGLLGNQIGGGTGKTVATAGGAVAGGVAGHEIEKRMNKHTVWITDVTLKNGRKRSVEQGSAPSWRAGDVVRIDAQGRLVRQ